MENQIKKIAITGGPCGGKSVVLDFLKNEFGDDVIMMPEVATQILEIPYDKGGPGIPGRDVEWSQKWQDNLQTMIIDKQILDETMLVQEADKRDRPTILVCDRGVLDGAAYLAGGRQEFLEKFNLEEGKCFDLYDQVIHLNSLATDNPELYQKEKETNQARFEDTSVARELDEKLFTVYEGHPNHTRVKATEGVEGKIEIVINELKKIFQKLNEASKESSYEIGEPSSLGAPK